MLPITIISTGTQYYNIFKNNYTIFTPSEKMLKLIYESIL